MSKSQRAYCFTTFKQEPIYNQDSIRYLVYQQEKCPSSGKLHWQGYAEFYSKITINTAKEFLGDNTAHLEKRHGTREEARDYCKKSETRINGPFEFGDWNKGGQGSRCDLHKLVEKLENGVSDYELLKTEPDTVERYRTFIKHSRSIIEEEKGKQYIQKEFNTDKKLNDFQLKCVEKLSSQNDRQILWINDSQGGSGKTWLSKYMIANMKAIRFTNGKTKDIAYAYKNNPIVVFDFARSCEDRINYQIIEDLKNGILFSSKYESQSKVFAPPKIIVMANFEPNKRALSEDRWTIMDLGNTNQVQLYHDSC